MAGVWTIRSGSTTYSSPQTVDEYQSFTESFLYSDVDYPDVIYNVIITPQKANETVAVSGNNISGYFTDVFNVQIKYKTKNPTPEYIDVINFRKIDLEKLEQVISYKPDVTPFINYEYIANAYDPTTKPPTLVATQTFTKKINNNWDLNKTLLLQYINSTVVADPNLFKPWINSINSAKVNWKNTSNIVINWA